MMCFVLSISMGAGNDSPVLLLSSHKTLGYTILEPPPPIAAYVLAEDAFIHFVILRDFWWTSGKRLKKSLVCSSSTSYLGLYSCTGIPVVGFLARQLQVHVLEYWYLFEKHTQVIQCEYSQYCTWFYRSYLDFNSVACM